MNKFAAIVLLALVAAVSANELEDERETGLLLGHERLFAPYCLNMRRYVVADIKQRAREGQSKIVAAFFGAASEISDEVLTAQKEAVVELAKQVAVPSTPIEDKPLNENQVLALIVQGKEEIRTRGFVGRMVEATKSATSVMLSAANSAIFVRLAKLRTEMNGSNLLAGVMSFCAQVGDYDQTLESELASAKESILEETSEPELRSFVEGVRVNGLGCFTTKSVLRVHAFCEVFKNGAGAFMKMLGLKEFDPKAVAAARTQ